MDRRRLQELSPPRSTTTAAAAFPDDAAEHIMDSSKHRGRRRVGRRWRGPAVSVVLLTALVACGFLLFLSAFMEIPFFSSSSSAEAQHKPASLASTSSHTQQRQKDDTAVDSEHHPEKQHVPAITLVDFDDAVAAFLDRARMENVEKQPVPLLATDDGNDDDPATLPRVAMLYYPTEHAAALALTKALEAALLEDGEAQPTAMEEVLGEEAAGEEDGWIIRVEGHRRASGDDSSDTQPSDFLLWFTSRVPPYGYGKSHGLAAVVRLLAFPPMHALEDEADVRDFVRWHCRISHVTAHTPTLTLELGSALSGWLRDDDDDGSSKRGGSRMLLQDAKNEEEGLWAGAGWEARLWDFLGLDPVFLPAAQDALTDEMAAAGVPGVFGWAGDDDDNDDDEGGDWKDDDDEGGKGKRVLMSVNEEVEVDAESIIIAPELRSIFIEEVGTMAAWPCGLIEATDLQPACHLTSWVHCTVPWDVCGKASCNGAVGADA